MAYVILRMTGWRQRRRGTNNNQTPSTIRSLTFPKGQSNFRQLVLWTLNKLTWYNINKDRDKKKFREMKWDFFARPTYRHINERTLTPMNASTHTYPYKHIRRTKLDWQILRLMKSLHEPRCRWKRSLPLDKNAVKSWNKTSKMRAHIEMKLVYTVSNPGSLENKTWT